jgi:hypothetical protein
MQYNRNKYDCKQGDIMTDKVEPISFKEQWEAKKLLKRTKKKAKKDLLNRGHSPREASGMIKQALKTIQSNKPMKRAAGRGG